MNTRPGAIYTAAQVRELDRRAIDDCGIPGYELMTRAGHALADAVRAQWPDARTITVLAGPGNNGGDGYVCARVARARRIEARVLALAPPASLKDDARRACEEFHAAGGRTQAFAPSAIDGEVIVDAIFGIGITRPASGDYAAAIDAANTSGRRILAVDVPSGLDADDGRAHGGVIRADATLSFIGRKLGCYLGSGPDHAGLRLFTDLDVPPRAYENVPVAAQLIGPDAVRAALPPRPRTAHKGLHGHVLVIGGASGMAGAARLAGEAALRAGAGLVSIATCRASAPAIAGRPELMVAAVDAAAELSPLLERASIVAVGPGLGRHDWSRAMLEAALASGLPAVVDADALNLLALAPRRREDWVLTPHPGEAARLLGVDAARVQLDRLGAARELQRRYDGTVVLKGAATIVQGATGLPSICDRGNPGMAVAGMGDVLTGVIAGIGAQCRDLPLAAAAGVLVHAEAGDRAARSGQRGLLAGDVIDELRRCVNPP
jgi:ADP-dependent NAD(P)H-hydrate dehydratase / NAD(P)H-hydrate epimerase